jgi:hypothetical protein
VTEAELLDEVTGVEEDLRVEVEPELEPVELELVELLDTVVELVELVSPVVVEALVPVVPEPDVTPVEATDAAARWVWPEKEAAATTEKRPVRPAAPATLILVRRPMRFTPSSRALVLFGGIRFPFSGLRLRQCPGRP